MYNYFKIKQFEMKRFNYFLLLVFFCMCGLFSFAQESSLPLGFSNGNTIWYLRTGVSFNGITGDGLIDAKTDWASQNMYGEYNETLGFSATLGANFPFGTGPIYYGLSITAGMRGYKEISSLKNGDSTYRNENRLTAFNIKLSAMNIGYFTKLTQNMVFDAHIGLYFSCDYAGSLKSENKTGKKTTNTSVNLSDIDDYNRYDFGINGGIGIWYNHWGLELGYERGLSFLYKGNDIYCYNYLLTIGYAF